MRHELVSINLLDGHAKNYNTHPPEQIEQLKASFDRFDGQVRSIVVAPDKNGRYTILAGHGIVEAALEAGMHSIECDIVPESWDNSTRDAYLVADNLHAQNSSPDEALLARLLQEQTDAGYDLSTLGTDDEALRQMVDALGDEYVGDDAPAPFKEFDETAADDLGTELCQECGKLCMKSGDKK